MEGETNRRADRQADRTSYKQTDRNKGRCTEERTNGKQTDKGSDGRMDTQTDVQRNRQADKGMNGRMDRQTDGPIFSHIFCASRCIYLHCCMRAHTHIHTYVCVCIWVGMHVCLQPYT
jgi:hypothetical protein